MDATPKDLAPASEGGVTTETPEARIAKIATQIGKSSLAREATQFPKGFQFNVEGPLIPINPNVFAGQNLGVLNIEGVGTDEITLDYRSHTQGKDFVIKIGNKVEIVGDVDSREIADLIPPLFAEINKYGHFMGDEMHAIHLGSMKNLEFYGKDGSLLPNHPMYKAPPNSQIKSNN